MLHSNTWQRLTAWSKQLGVAAVYALLDHVVYLYSKSDAIASIFEPASGWALAVLLVGGMRYAWGVLLGALLIHFMSDNPFWVTAAAALGHTLGAMLGAWLLARDARFNSRLRSLRDYLQLIFLGGIGYSIGALASVAALRVYGALEPGAFLPGLIRWWMGDVLGIILITPLFLVWRLEKSDWLEMKRVHVAVLLLGLTFLVGQVVFLDWFFDNTYGVPRGYMMFLFIAWVAVRLGTWGTMIALVMTAVQALQGAH